MKKFKKLFFIILGILVCLSINFSYAIDLNLLDSTNLESNSIPNESYANNANSNVNTSNSITNNVTGSGTNNYLVKWNGTNTVTNGPKITSGGTGYLKEDKGYVSIYNDRRVSGYKSYPV